MLFLDSAVRVEFGAVRNCLILFCTYLLSSCLSFFWMIILWYIMVGYLEVFLVEFSSPSRACPMWWNEFFVGRESLAMYVYRFFLFNVFPGVPPPLKKHEKRKKCLSTVR